MRVVAVVAVAVAGACARQGAPPGGPEDRRPPVVVSTFPEPFDTVTELGANIRFEFDERISERAGGATLQEAVTISPSVGEVRIGHGRRSLTVDPSEPFRPGIVYRVTLEPMVVDMFGNTLTDPFELVFSTGGDPVATTVAGEVWDRITGRASAASLHATGEDSLVHLATAGQDGIYAFRYLPGGRYRLVAFQDQNRNRLVDSTEVQGTTDVDIVAGDTLFLDVSLLTPDTLPAMLMSAAAADSVTVALTFDDFLHPDAAIEAVEVSLSRGEGDAPTVSRLMYEAGYAAFVEQVADSLARLDSIDAAARADSVAAAAAEAAVNAPDSLANAGDTAVVAGDTAAAPDAPPPVADTAIGLGPPGRQGLPGAPGGRGQGPAERGPARLEALGGARPGPMEGTGRVLPGRRIVALLQEPLERDVEYTVTVASVTNINGLPRGGGEATVVLVSPPPDTTGADTLAPDSGAVQPDTGAAQPDTGVVGGPMRRSPGALQPFLRRLLERR